MIESVANKSEADSLSEADSHSWMRRKPFQDLTLAYINPLEVEKMMAINRQALSTDCFFIEGDDCAKNYKRIRDLPKYKACKKHIETLWIRYKPYAGAQPKYAIHLMLSPFQVARLSDYRRSKSG